MHEDLSTGRDDVVGSPAQPVTTASWDAKMVLADGGALIRVVTGSLLAEGEDEMKRIWLVVFLLLDGLSLVLFPFIFSLFFFSLSPIFLSFFNETN